MGPEVGRLPGGGVAFVHSSELKRKLARPVVLSNTRGFTIENPSLFDGSRRWLPDIEAWRRAEASLSDRENKIAK